VIVSTAKFDTHREGQCLRTTWNELAMKDGSRFWGIIDPTLPKVEPVATEQAEHANGEPGAGA
jgi:hypothetical protein